MEPCELWRKDDAHPTPAPFSCDWRCCWQLRYRPVPRRSLLRHILKIPPRCRMSSAPPCQTEVLIPCHHPNANSLDVEAGQLFLHPLVQVRSPLIFTGRGGDLRSGLPATAPLAGCESQPSGSCEDCQDRQYVGQSIETTCPGRGKDLLTVLPNHIVHYLIFVLAGCREAAELHLHALSGLTLMD